MKNKGSNHSRGFVKNGRDIGLLTEAWLKDTPKDELGSTSQTWGNQLLKIQQHKQPDNKKGGLASLHQKNIKTNLIESDHTNKWNIKYGKLWPMIHCGDLKPKHHINSNSRPIGCIWHSRSWCLTNYTLRPFWIPRHSTQMVWKLSLLKIL